MFITPCAIKVLGGCLFACLSKLFVSTTDTDETVHTWSIPPADVQEEG